MVKHINPRTITLIVVAIALLVGWWVLSELLKMGVPEAEYRVQISFWRMIYFVAGSIAIGVIIKRPPRDPRRK